MDWDKLRIFHAVAQAGSFTHAGEELHLSQSAVSRQVSALEDDLSIALFHRHARGLILTEQGELLYQTAQDVFSKLSTVQATLSDSRARPVGELRVTTTVGFGSTWLTPRIGEFLENYPEIEVSLICDDRELDLGMREADVAIRMAMPTQPDLVKLRLCTIHTHLYAAPEYLDRHGAPKVLEEIDEHNLIVYGEEAPPTLRNVNWPLFIGLKAHNQRKPRLQVNNIYGLLLAAEMVSASPRCRTIWCGATIVLSECCRRSRGPVSTRFSSIPRNFGIRRESMFSGIFWQKPCRIGSSDLIELCKLRIA